MFELFHSVLIEEEMQAQSDILDKYKVFNNSSVKDFNEFFCSTFIEFVNNTRRWANCGFTPHEIACFRLG